ncbi:MAG: hypothetical protein KBC64_01575 [Simkaniaceae bacterium]|nr:hypothetical protein [Simkaniaceae bacterium]
MIQLGNLKKYWPLFVLILVAMLGARALAANWVEWMPLFMGFFFCQFAMLKLFHPAGFAEGFCKYDLLAKQVPIYAYIYPLIELGLGLGYLSGMNLLITEVITVVVMGIGAVGVVIALRAGLELKCACMGTVLDVPLSTVTLVEDLGMGFMALLMLLDKIR